jgi:phosphopantothenoylcysteine decarboxylase/phosphopantothenate--cysteine ligase
MGFSLATEAVARGARTVLVAGPVHLPTPRGVERVDVETALEMGAQVEAHAERADLVIMTAAVSDFRPGSPAKEKLKKEMGRPDLQLEANPDILAGLARMAPDAIRVGFAAETRDLETEGQRKLQAKEAHFIVANDVSRSDIGFASEDNEVIVLTSQGQPVRIPRQSKRHVARKLLNLFVEALKEREAGPVTSGH